MTKDDFGTMAWRYYRQNNKTRNGFLLHLRLSHFSESIIMKAISFQLNDMEDNNFLFYINIEQVGLLLCHSQIYLQGELTKKSAQLV